MKQPMKSRDVLPKNVPGVGWGGVEHNTTEFHKKCTCLTFYWIHFANNDHTVAFLTLIYWQITGPSDPDKHADLWQNSLIMNHLAFYLLHMQKR